MLVAAHVAASPYWVTLAWGPYLLDSFPVGLLRQQRGERRKTDDTQDKEKGTTARDELTRPSVNHSSLLAVEFMGTIVFTFTCISIIRKFVLNRCRMP